MKPTIGRIVWFSTSRGSADMVLETHCALITKVTSPDVRALNFSTPDEARHRVALRVFTERGDFSLSDVPFETTAVHGHWTWPQKEGQ